MEKCGTCENDKCVNFVVDEMTVKLLEPVVYYDYQNGSLCNRVTVEGHFNDDNWHNVEVTIEGDSIKVVMDYNTSHTSSNTSRCQDVSFVHRSTKITVGGVSGLHDYLQDFSDQEFYGCVQNLMVDDVSIILNQKFNSLLVNIQVEGYVNAVSNECRNITEKEHIDSNHSFEVIIYSSGVWSHCVTVNNTCSCWSYCILPS